MLLLFCYIPTELSHSQLNWVYFVLPKHINQKKTTFSCYSCDPNSTHLDTQHSSGEKPATSALSKKKKIKIELHPIICEWAQALLQLIKFAYSLMCYNTL